MALLNLKKYQDPKIAKEILINTEQCHLIFRKDKVESNIAGAPKTEIEVIDIVLAAGMVLQLIPKDEQAKTDFLSHFTIT